jgi:hypothetical protein
LRRVVSDVRSNLSIRFEDQFQDEEGIPHRRSFYC